MSKKYTVKETRLALATVKELRLILATVVANNLFHMYHFELELEKLKLKMDGTDDAESLRKAAVYTNILTVMNDVIHPAHSFSKLYFDVSVIERYQKNQDIAVKNKIVNPCKCKECEKRGRDALSKMDMATGTKSTECKDNTPEGGKPDSSVLSDESN